MGGPLPAVEAAAVLADLERRVAWGAGAGRGAGVAGTRSGSSAAGLDLPFWTAPSCTAGSRPLEDDDRAAATRSDGGMVRAQKWQRSRSRHGALSRGLKPSGGGIKEFSSVFVRRLQRSVRIDRCGRLSQIPSSAARRRCPIKLRRAKCPSSLPDDGAPRFRPRPTSSPPASTRVRPTGGRSGSDSCGCRIVEAKQPLPRLTSTISANPGSWKPARGRLKEVEG